MSSIKKLISLDEALAYELEILSKVLNKSQRDIIESALSFYFDYTDGIVADKITDEIKSGKINTYDSSVVYRKLGIDLV
ncbi:MAG: hypothetical protein SVN78_08645 [Deferribacterota bacterium]|nr:hypothetical protein [Deferribacterota bacterium]